MLLGLNSHFMNIVCNMCNTRRKTTASAVGFIAILSCEIVDFRQQLAVCVDSINESKETEKLPSYLV